MPSLEKFCERMDYYCRVASVGYDWARRWDVFDGGDTDCSALVITCLREAGFDTGSASYTGNMSAELTARGWKRLPCDLSACRKGDILLNDANHVAAVVAGEGRTATLAQASIGETGGVYGNRPGDQTGNETNERRVYDYPWDCILRYAGPLDEKEDDDLKPVSNGSGSAYRMLDPKTGNHHFATTVAEKRALVKAGWTYEGVAWKFSTAKDPVYRMYLAANGDHLLTCGYEEAVKCQKAGWAYEGVPFFAKDEGKEVHRLVHSKSNLHHFTADANERDELAKSGWKYEGVAFHV